MKKVNQEKYIQSLKKALKQVGKRVEKTVIEEEIQTHYYNGIISQETYEKAKTEINEHFEDPYIKILKTAALKKATEENRKEIEKDVQRAYDKGVISSDIYTRAMQEIDLHFRNMPLRARIRVTELNNSNRYSQEGHAIQFTKNSEQDREEEK